MIKVALYFSTDTNFKTASEFVEAALHYVDGFDFDPAIHIVSPESVNVVFGDTERVQQVTGDLGLCVTDYNYTIIMNDLNASDKMKALVDNIIIATEIDDGISLSSLKNHLYEEYVSNALVIDDDQSSVLEFIDNYLDVLRSSKNKKEIEEVKKGLDILKDKLS